MNNKPLVTVITVTYNSSKYVREAIESVLAQDYINIEYIIADDCSTDETWEIIQEYKDSRIIAYRNETNLREYPNRNKAIDKAKGEYLIFIDGDDYIYPHALQVLTTYMIKFSEVAFAIMCSENKNYIYPLMLSSKEIYQIEFSEFGLINKSLAHTFYRSSIIKINKFEVGEYMAGDTLNRLVIGMKFPILLVNDNLTWWREYDGQASQKLKNSYRNEQYLMSINLFRDNKCPLNSNEKNRYIKNSKIKISRHIFSLLKHGRFKGALKTFLSNNFFVKDLFFIFKSLDFNNPIQSIIKNKSFEN